MPNLPALIELVARRSVSGSYLVVTNKNTGHITYHPYTQWLKIGGSPMIAGSGDLPIDPFTYKALPVEILFWDR